MKKKARFRVLCALFIFAVCLSFFAFTVHTTQIASVPDKNAADRPIVIVDAGHGGADGGAVAYDGTEEQILNLQIAKLLEQQLFAFGIETVMTRTNEDSIHDESANTIREKKVTDIHNRMAIMESHPDALFVSIHQNKYTDSSQQGTQVFYSPNTTTSPALADCIQKSVVSLLQPENTREIKKSGSSIYLLYYAKQTAVLVECGFLSNQHDTELLKDEEYQKQMAFAIATGILNYLNL